jgi:putative hemolysin
VSLAEPLEEPLGFLGGAARPASIIAVTLLLSYVTLVFGELAPKRVAMQRAERWGLVAARPLALLSSLTRPVVWLLSRSADIAVKLVGADPDQQREDVTEEELRDMVAVQPSFTPHQRTIISGAFEVADRRLNDVLRPRRDVTVLDATATCEQAIRTLIDAGYSRAPVATDGDLDEVVGVVHLRDLIAQGTTAGEVARPPMFFPEAAKVLDALRQMQLGRQQLAVVIDEHGGGEGIVTVEDLLEEIVGEIYDESDRDILSVEREADGALVLPGRFPIHDLVDVDVSLPEGDYSTVAGLVLHQLGRIPEQPGDVVVIDGWEATVLAVEERALTKIRLRPVAGDAGDDQGGEPGDRS